MRTRTPRHGLRLLALGVGLALPSPAAAATLVTYARSGGIAGDTTALTVHKDRRAEREDQRTGTKHFRLSQSRYEALRHALIAARFSSLASSYRPPEVVNDGYTETVRFRGKTVSVSTGATPPKRLERVLAKLRALT